MLNVMLRFPRSVGGVTRVCLLLITRCRLLPWVVNCLEILVQGQSGRLFAGKKRDRRNFCIKVFRSTLTVLTARADSQCSLSI